MLIEIAPGAGQSARAATEEGLRRAAGVIKSGGLAVFPTDTIYGLGASARCQDAVDRIFQLKGRRRQRSLPVLVASKSQAEELAELGEAGRDLAARFWPGALTLVARRRPGFDTDLGGPRDGGIGIRVPGSEIARGLCELCGPLIGTSANLSGEPAPTSAAAIESIFGHAVDVYLDGGPCKETQPSTVVDVRGRPKLLRAGAIDPVELGLEEQVQ